MRLTVQSSRPDHIHPDFVVVDLTRESLEAALDRSSANRTLTSKELDHVEFAQGVVKAYSANDPNKLAKQLGSTKPKECSHYVSDLLRCLMLSHELDRALKTHLAFEPLNAAPGLQTLHEPQARTSSPPID